MLEATIYSTKLFVRLISEDFWELFLILCEFSLKHPSLFLERGIAVVITILKLYELYVIKISVNCQTTNTTQMSVWKLSSKQEDGCSLPSGGVQTKEKWMILPLRHAQGSDCATVTPGAAFGTQASSKQHLSNKQTFSSAFTYSD